MEQICNEKVFNIPNVLTMIRIALLPAVVWFFRAGNTIGALVVYIAAMLTDVVDGYIARKYNQITSLGKLIDPIADKLSLLTLLGLFVADGQIPLWVLIVIFVKELLMVIGASVALRNGIVVYALPIGKVTTVTFTASIIARFLSLTLAADVLMYVSVALAMAAFVWYSLSSTRKLNEKKREAASRA